MPKKEDIRAPSEERVIREIPVDKIDPFPDHPFKVVDDGDMDQLAESIRAKGLMTPILVRKMKGGRFEVVSGHRRLFACEKLGMDRVICEVKEMSKDEAIISMVESNFHRDKLLPSEKAFAYKMRLDAMKMQISRMRENQKKGRNIGGKPVGPQLEEASEHMSRAYGISRKEIADIGNAASRRGNPHWVGDDKYVSPVGKQPRSGRTLEREVGESQTQIYRYIRLTELTPELLDLVDEGKLGMRTAVELSYLEHRQKDVYECMEMEDCMPTHAQAIRLRRQFQEGDLTPGDISAILTENKPNQIERISLRMDRFEKLIPPKLDKREREDYIEEALKHYARYRQRKSRGLER